MIFQTFCLNFGTGTRAIICKMLNQVEAKQTFFFEAMVAHGGPRFSFTFLSHAKLVSEQASFGRMND